MLLNLNFLSDSLTISFKTLDAIPIPSNFKGGVEELTIPIPSPQPDIHGLLA